MALNDRNRFTIATGPEGSPLPTDDGTYLNDVEGLVVHEIGHALGLGHSDVFDGSACDYTHVNHLLAPDDVAGIQGIYGSAAPPVPLSPAAGVVLGFLLAALGARESLRSRLTQAR
jgi:hypothetical protein